MNEQNKGRFHVHDVIIFWGQDPTPHTCAPALWTAGLRGREPAFQFLFRLVYLGTFAV